MTKTVKELLGEKRNPYLRSKADQKFAADFTTDTSINNDDATEHEPNFKATNVASVEREKEGHGWDTEDISSKDGTDLEDADFKGTEKRLKAYKKLTALKEDTDTEAKKLGWYKHPKHGKWVHDHPALKGASLTSSKYASEDYHDAMKAYTRKQKTVKEQQYKFLQGTNISPSKQSKTLKKIANNSAKKADDASNKADKEPWQKGNRSLHLNMMADALKQRSGVIKDYLDKRKSRAVKEEVARLDELGTNTLVRYMVKAEKQGRSDKKLKLAAKKYKEAVDRQSPIGIGSQKPRKLKEEVLAELSKATLQSYVKKARKGLNKVRKDADKAVSNQVRKGPALAKKNDDAGLNKLAHNVGKTSAKQYGRETGIPKAESKLRRSSQYTKIKAGDLNEEIEQLDEASKVELYGRYVSDIKTTMTEVGKLLSTLAKHNQEGWIDLYSIRETFNRVQILRDDISGSVEVAERDAAQRKKWAKENEKSVGLREGVELFNNLPRRRNV